MKKEAAVLIQVTLTWVGAFLSAKLGELFPLLCALAIMMFIDYITGMLASKAEAIEYPENPGCGWNSKKGAKGIIKKIAYVCVIAVALAVDYGIFWASDALDFDMPLKVLFGLLVTVWYLLNELLSIIENAGRMGAPVPEWLAAYISVLKNKIDSSAEKGNL